MSTTLPVHGGGAQPISIDTSGKVAGGPALRCYIFASSATAQAAGYVCEGGPAMSVAVVDDPWKQEGDPLALPVYVVPDGYPVEGGFAVPIVSV